MTTNEVIAKKTLGRFTHIRSIGETMGDDTYDQLADARDRLPNEFPRTDSEVELEILKRIFTQEEARIAGKLGREMESYADISMRLGLDPEAAKAKLSEMARKELLWSTEIGGTPHYRLAPWIVGIYEAQKGRVDHELAHLIEDYFQGGGMAGLMPLNPPTEALNAYPGSIKWFLRYVSTPFIWAD
jgi:electron transport complex protein RnfB